MSSRRLETSMPTKAGAGGGALSMTRSRRGRGRGRGRVRGEPRRGGAGVGVGPALGDVDADEGGSGSGGLVHDPVSLDAGCRALVTVRVPVTRLAGPTFWHGLKDPWDSGLPPAYPIPVPDRVTPTYETGQ